MGFFDGPLFDFNGDGVEDPVETYLGMEFLATGKDEIGSLEVEDRFCSGFDDADEDDEEDEDDF